MMYGLTVYIIINVTNYIKLLFIVLLYDTVIVQMKKADLHQLVVFL